MSNNEIKPNWTTKTKVVDLPFFRSIVNVASSYRAGLRTGHKRIGISPVRTIDALAYANDIAHTLSPFT